MNDVEVALYASPRDAHDAATSDGGTASGSRKVLATAGLPSSSQLATAFAVAREDQPKVAVEVEVVTPEQQEVRTLQYAKADGVTVVGVRELPNGEVAILHRNGTLRMLQVCGCE